MMVFSRLRGRGGHTGAERAELEAVAGKREGARTVAVAGIGGQRRQRIHTHVSSGACPWSREPEPTRNCSRISVS